uniref:Uncharacterized protein n=1 Tax=Arundo donax TaxID=35708 RepID=A0A0A9GJV0_ARUDO
MTGLPKAISTHAILIHNHHDTTRRHPRLEYTQGKTIPISPLISII